MRPALSVFLIALLASCPIVCGTAHAMPSDHGELGHHHGPGNTTSLPAPANDDDCLCNGALKATQDGIAIDGVGQPISAPLMVPAPLPIFPASPSAPVLVRGTPPDDVNGGARRPFLRC